MLHAIRPILWARENPYYLNDAGLAAFLKRLRRRLETAAYLEQFARRAYSVGVSRAFYYRTTKGSVIHLLTQSPRSFMRKKSFTVKK